MKLVFAELSSVGPVRHHNEDSLAVWQPDSDLERDQRGAIAAIADGVGGWSCGEIASRLAVDTAVKLFKDAKPDSDPQELLSRIFKTANLDIYNFGMQSDQKRMATTLSVSILRQSELVTGHVGDCRVYRIRNGQIQKLTSDHTYVEMQLKLGLISERDAAASELRSVLTRTLGQDPMIQVDFNRIALVQKDCVVQCSDGLHNCLLEHEICDAIVRLQPEDACRHLISLAENRGAEDNISIQIVRVDQLSAGPSTEAHQGRGHLHAADSASEDFDLTEPLDGRFEITDVIHRSGMSTVFKAVDRQSGQPVALKVPLMSLESDPAFFSRFEREEEIGKSLDHPGILKFIPVEKKSRPYIVMEYLEGQTLDRVLRRTRPLPVPSALQIASKLCDALAYMHRKGVIHRDLKPQNIMVCGDGSLRIMDFGIAKTIAMKRITFGGFSPTMGTPDYMAPEQIKGKRGDERTDIYSLGAILFEMVTGQVPFQGPNAFAVMNARLTGDPPAPSELNSDLSPQVEEVILHAMEREPNDRYPSAGAMKAELDDPKRVKLSGRSERLVPPTPWKNRFRSIRLVVIAIVVPIAAFLFFWWIFSHRGGN